MISSYWSIPVGISQLLSAADEVAAELVVIVAVTLLVVHNVTYALSKRVVARRGLPDVQPIEVRH